MKLSKNMEWAEPYLARVWYVIPEEKIAHIKGYTVTPNRYTHQDACITQHGRRYTITIRLNEYRLPVRLEDALIALAHELAHVVHWEHTPEHLELTSNLLWQFSQVTKREGVQDTNKRLLKRKKAQ